MRSTSLGSTKPMPPATPPSPSTAKKVSGRRSIACARKTWASARVYGWGNASRRLIQTFQLLPCTVSAGASSRRQERTTQRESSRRMKDRVAPGGSATAEPGVHHVVVDRAELVADAEADAVPMRGGQLAAEQEDLLGGPVAGRQVQLVANARDVPVDVEGESSKEAHIEVPVQFGPLLAEVVQELDELERESARAPGLAEAERGLEGMAGQCLLELVEDGHFLVAIALDPNLIANGEGPSRRLGVGEDVVLEPRWGAEGGRPVGERGGGA